MTHTEFSIKTTDGTTLFAQQWLPDGAIRASINLVHGLGEHSGRYTHVAEAFNQKGFVVSAIDLRGHGRTQGPRGHIPSYATAANDIIQLITQSATLFPGTPQFLYGHSLGGALVLFTSLYHKPAVNGVIATSPGLDPGEVPPAKLLAARVLSRLAPSFAMKNGLDVTNLSHDQAVITAYQTDPLVHPLISTRLGFELLTNGRQMMDFKGQFPYPLLLLQGAQDRLVNPLANQRFAAQLTGDVTFKMFPEGYHELHNEPWKTDVLAVMTEWLEEKLA